MKIWQKVVSTAGMIALALAMSASGAVASSDSADVSVNVRCRMPMTVSIEGAGVFQDYDIASLGDGKSTTTSPFTVMTDVGCYIGAWHVNAEITAFNGPGPLFFPGSWFSLEYVQNSVVAPWAAVKPVASSQEFAPAPGYGGQSEFDIFETAEIMAWLPWIGVYDTGQDWPAPFRSSAKYNGQLENLNHVLPGTYTATLTVELITGEGED